MPFLSFIIQLWWRFSLFHFDGEVFACDSILLSFLVTTSRISFVNKQVFFKENIRYPVWICRDPISLNLGTRFSLILGTRFSIPGTRIGSLKRLKKLWCKQSID